jgi:D-alanine-D-alanine ligase
MVKERNTLHLAYANAAQHDPLVIAEKGVMGGEYTVGIVGSGDDMTALPIIKIEPVTEFYDYEAKYSRDDTRYLCPCGLPEALEGEIRAGALAAFRIIDGRGWGRVDFLLDEDGNHYFLEVNTSPGMTDHSLVPMAARAAGMDYPALVRRVLELAAND